MKNTNRWSVLVLVTAVVIAVAVSSFIAMKNRDYQAKAKKALRSGVSAAEQYGADHEGDYRGMTAAILKNQYESSLDFADGAGSAVNTVYISGLGVETYILTVKARDGSVYTATKTADGNVKM